MCWTAPCAVRDEARCALADIHRTSTQLLAADSSGSSRDGQVACLTAWDEPACIPAASHCHQLDREPRTHGITSAGSGKTPTRRLLLVLLLLLCCWWWWWPCVLTKLKCSKMCNRQKCHSPRPVRFLCRFPTTPFHTQSWVGAIILEPNHGGPQLLLTKLISRPRFVRTGVLIKRLNYVAKRIH